MEEGNRGLGSTGPGGPRRRGERGAKGGGQTQGAGGRNSKSHPNLT